MSRWKSPSTAAIRAERRKKAALEGRLWLIISIGSLLIVFAAYLWAASKDWLGHTHSHERGDEKHDSRMQVELQ